MTFFFPIIPITLFLIFNFLNDNFSNVHALIITSALTTLFLCIIAFYNIVEVKSENYQNEINKLEQKYKEEIARLEQENENLKASYNLKRYIKEKFKNGTKYLAELYCDINTVDFDLLSNYLEFKKHPAIKKRRI